jgi:hypothetical protein
MLAVSPAMVDFSQESRPYSLLILLVLLSAAGVLEWVRGLKGGSVPYGALALFFVAALLAFYTHFTSIFWVVPAVLAGREITDRMGSQKAKRAYVVAQILILLLAIPEAVRAVGRAKFGSFGFLENVTPARLVVQWGDVVLPSGLWNGRAGHGSPVSAAVLALFVAIIVARLWPARAQLLEWARENPARPLVIATLTVVPLFVWCFGYLVTPIFMYRSILLGAPGFILILALADQFYRWPIASSTFVALSAAALISNGTVRAKEQWLSVAQTLKAESQHGDGIVMCPDWRISSLLHALGPLAERPLYIVRNSTVIPLLLQDGTGRWEKIAHQLVFRDWVEGVLQGGEPKPDLRYAPTPARLWLVDSECPADDRAALAKWFAPASPRTVAVFRTRPLDPGIRVSLVEGQPISRPVAMREAAVDTSGR